MLTDFAITYATLNRLDMVNLMFANYQEFPLEVKLAF